MVILLLFLYQGENLYKFQTSISSFFSISITWIEEVGIDCVLMKCMLYFAEK